MVKRARVTGVIVLVATVGLLTYAALDHASEQRDPSIVTSIGDEGPAVDPAVRATSLTPGRESLPALAPTAELERAAQSIPPSDRVNLPDGTWLLAQLHPLLHPLGTDARPVFTKVGTLVGIAVPGIGVLPREIYDDPSTDFEAVARETWGAEEYDRRIAVVEGQPRHF